MAFGLEMDKGKLPGQPVVAANTVDYDKFSIGRNFPRAGVEPSVMAAALKEVNANSRATTPHIQVDHSVRGSADVVFLGNHPNRIEGIVHQAKAGPASTKPTATNHWIKTGPHVMVVGADPSFYDAYPKSADPDTSVPYVMWAGTPYQHLMAPVK